MNNSWTGCLLDRRD